MYTIFYDWCWCIGLVSVVYLTLLRNLSLYFLLLLCLNFILVLILWCRRGLQEERWLTYVVSGVDLKDKIYLFLSCNDGDLCSWRPSSRFLFQSRFRLLSAGTTSASAERWRVDAWSASAGTREPWSMTGLRRYRRGRSTTGQRGFGRRLIGAPSRRDCIHVAPVSSA